MTRGVWSARAVCAYNRRSLGAGSAFLHGRGRGARHAGCSAGVRATPPGTDRTLHPLHRPSVHSPSSVFPSEESRAQGSRSHCPSGVLVPVHTAPGMLSPHSRQPQQWAPPRVWPPRAGVGCCSSQCPQDCGPQWGRGCWESPSCISQVGRGSEGSSHPWLGRSSGAARACSPRDTGRGPLGSPSPGPGGWAHPGEGAPGPGTSAACSSLQATCRRGRSRDHGAFPSNRFPGQAVAHFSGCGGVGKAEFHSSRWLSAPASGRRGPGLQRSSVCLGDLGGGGVGRGSASPEQSQPVPLWVELRPEGLSKWMSLWPVLIALTCPAWCGLCCCPRGWLQ